MKIKIIKSFRIREGISLFIIFISIGNLNCQIKSRTSLDSSRAAANGYWYYDNMFQFQTKIPKLLSVPPLRSDMDFETLFGYNVLDSIIKTKTSNELNTITSSWLKQKTKNDTIINAIKYLYKLTDFSPILFNQYNNSLNRMIYKSNVSLIKSNLSEIIDEIFQTKTSTNSAFKMLYNSDYILKVKVNNINSMPYKTYRTLDTMPGINIYNVNAMVLDTLKGKEFSPCSLNNSNFLINNCNICFNYITGPYSNSESDLNIHPSLLDNLGNLALQQNQELIIVIGYCNYYLDFNFDYFDLSVIKVFPIINNIVYDINKEWSDSKTLNYDDWKLIFLDKRLKLLNGGY